MQKNCTYEPHVLALMTGQPFEIENNDPAMHNVHPMPKCNRQSSTSQPVGSAALKSMFARPERAMPVLCNVHPWMRSFVFAFDNLYFAVTSRSVKFELRNLPPATYRPSRSLLRQTAGLATRLFARGGPADAIFQSFRGARCLWGPGDMVL
jgi:hypothetical protein